MGNLLSSSTVRPCPVIALQGMSSGNTLSRPAHKVCTAVFLDKSGIPLPRFALLIRYSSVKRGDWLKSTEAILPCMAVYSRSKVVKFALESMSIGKSPAEDLSAVLSTVSNTLLEADSLGTELLPKRRKEDKETIFANVPDSRVGTFGNFSSLRFHEL